MMNGRAKRFCDVLRKSPGKFSQTPGTTEERYALAFIIIRRPPFLPTGDARLPCFAARLSTSDVAGWRLSPALLCRSPVGYHERKVSRQLEVVS